jgi:hypothetical protein
MSTTAANSIAGVVIPDTELVREISAFIRDTEDNLLFDPSFVRDDFVDIIRNNCWPE